jgi:hypothetical protein
MVKPRDVDIRALRRVPAVALNPDLKVGKCLCIEGSLKGVLVILSRSNSV